MTDLCKFLHTISMQCLEMFTELYKKSILLYFKTLEFMILNVHTVIASIYSYVQIIFKSKKCILLFLRKTLFLFYTSRILYLFLLYIINIHL